jgi:hypothetical protein
MKKLLKMLGLLVIAGSLFFSCSNGNSDDNGGSAGNGGGNSGSGTSQTANSIQLSDGNWTVKMKMSAKGTDMYYTLHATVTGNGKNITYTSGTMDTAMDMSSYSGFTDAQMEAEVADMNAALAGSGMTYTYDSKTKTLFMCYVLGEDELAEMSGDMDMSTIPSGVEVHSNADKTEYTFTMTQQGTTVIYTITKDK